MQVPVHLEPWEIECCVDPPSVGAVVAWQLMFREIDSAQSGHDVLQATVRAEPCEAADILFGSPIRLTAAGLSMYWDAPRAAAGVLSISGRVHTDFHGYVPDDFPTTVGTVRSVAVKYSGGLATPIAPPSFRPVHASPKWFSREQVGVLVVIEVGDPPQR